MANYKIPFVRRKKVYHKPKDIPTLKDLLSSFIKDRKLEGIIESFEIIDSWNELVGENIANISEATRYENKILYVRIKNSVWRSELFMIQKDIIIKFNTHFKKRVIDRIMFV